MKRLMLSHNSPNCKDYRFIKKDKMKHCLLRTQEEMTNGHVDFSFFFLYCFFCWLFVTNFTSDNDNGIHRISRYIMAKVDLQ